ncbi:hypothetical protein ACFE04_006572 [Oxalis oulophora]
MEPPLVEGNGTGNGIKAEALPPPPPIPPNVVPIKAEPEPVKNKIVRVPMARRGPGSKGQKISLLTNHFKVSVTNVDNEFFHYSVSSELLCHMCLNNGKASPDGDASPNDADRKRLRRPYNTKTFKVEFSYAAKIPMAAIGQALRGQESENSQEALRVLDIILRQHSAKHNQGAKDPFSLDWSKAKRALKNLRITASPSNHEFRITGLSDKPCKEQMFELKQKDAEPLEVTVYDYFVNHRQIDLRYSGDLPCINVGKPKRPTYIPLEALSNSKYNNEPMLRSCGISISNSFTNVDGRVLQAPRLMFGHGEGIMPRNGRWNYNNKKFALPVNIEKWAVVNFSARCDVRGLIRDLTRLAESKGMQVEAPFDVFEESPQFRRAPPLVRVEKMYEEIQSQLPGPPKFLLCLLPDKKNSDIYGPWKKKNLADFGVVTQCLAPTRVNDNYLTNLLLKINAKLGGLNSMLAIEQNPNIPMVSKVPTIILGMDVSHGSPGHSDVPSIAAGGFVGFLYKDGVSESQFTQVLNIELGQIIEACKFLDENWNPKFLVIIAQKNHHTKFFLSGSPDNVPPGKYRYCLPPKKQRLLSLCPCWDDLAPVCYAHLAASQVGTFMKFEETSETNSSHGGMTAAGPAPVPQLPKLQEAVSSSMFFC